MSVIGASGVQALTLDAAQVAGFIDFMAEKHGFDKAELAAIFNRAKGHEKIIEAMTRARRLSLVVLLAVGSGCPPPAPEQPPAPPLLSKP